MSRAATGLAPLGALPLTVHPPGTADAEAVDRAHARLRSRAWPFLFAFAIYVALALAVWWHLLAHGFGAALPAGSADPSQEVWFIAWVPHALGAGLNPFFSHSVFAPSGVNMLDNTSMDLLGLLLAPVTLTAGPVASLDVAVLLAPALSALAAFTLCRRYVSWSPGAFCGGLCYGFGPFLTGDLRYAHLDLTWLVLPPLIFCCLDALLIRHTRRPTLAGGVLGILVVAQFFVSTEILAISALTAVVVAVVVSVGWPHDVVRSLTSAWKGLVLAALIVIATLAYPFWVVVDGPRNVVGPIWHHIGAIATSLAATVEPHGQLAGVAFISGSNGSYLGVTFLAVLVVGAVVLWRSPVLRVALITALVAYVASLGYRLHAGHHALGIPLPAALLGHVPLLDSIVPERFAAMVDLFCGLALAVVVDHVRRWERRPAGRVQVAAASRTALGAVPYTPTTSVLVTLALAIGAFALVPFVGLPHWPYAVTTIRRPPVFTRPTSSAFGASPARTGETGGVPDVAFYPDTSASVADEMVWQAEDGFSFTLADGYAIVPGPGRRAVEAPPTDALWLVFAAGSVHRLRLPLTVTTRGAVIGDVRALGVDDIVVLPGSEGSRAVRRALSETFGPPSRGEGGVARWTLRRASS